MRSLLLLLLGALAHAQFETTNTFLSGVTLVSLEDSADFDVTLADPSVLALLVPGEGGNSVSDITTTAVFVLRNVSCDAIQLTGSVGLSLNDLGALSLIDFTASGVEITCKGLVAWDAPVTLNNIVEVVPVGDEYFEVSVTSGNVATTVAVEVVANEANFVNVSDCTSSVVTSSTPVFTNPSSRIQNLISVLLPTLLEERLLCEFIKVDIGEAFDQGLQDINLFVADTVASESPNASFSEDLMLQTLTAQELEDAIKFSESSLVEVFSVVLNEVLGNPSNSSSSNELVVNSVVRNLTDQTAEFSFQFGNTSDMTRDLNLTLVGLDTFTLFDVLNSTLDYSFQSDIALLDSGIRFDFTRDFIAPGSYLNGSLILANPMRVFASVLLSLGENNASIITASAVNPNELSEVLVGQMQENTVTCGSPFFYRVNLSSLELSVDEAQVTVEVLDLEDAGWLAVLSEINSIVTSLFSDTLQTNIVDFTRGSLPFLTEELNEFLDEKQLEECPAFVVDDSLADDLVDFQDDFIQSLVSTLSDVNNPDVGINRVVEELSEAADLLPGYAELGPETIDIEIDGASDVVRINLTKIQLQSLNTFQVFDVLQPVGNSSRKTFNSVRLGTITIIVELELFTPLGADSAAGELEYFDTWEIVLNDVVHEAQLDLQVVENQFRQLALGELLETCIASVFKPGDGWRYDSFGISTSSVASFDCAGCGLNNDDEQGIADTIVEQIELADTFLENNIINDDYTFVINRELEQAGGECLGTYSPPTVPPTVNSNDEIVLVTTTSVLAVGFTSAFLVGCAVRTRRRSREVDWSLRAYSSKRNAIAVPVLSLLAVVCYIIGNIEIMGNLVIRFLNEDVSRNFRLDEIYSLTIVSGVEDLLNENLVFLALSFGFFSAALPFTRVLLDLYLFFTPCMTRSGREIAVSFSQLIGKWVVVDQLLIATLIAAFELTTDFKSESDSFRFLDNIIGVALVPGAGLVFHLLGFACSTVVGHMLCAAQNTAVQSEEEVVAQRADLKSRKRDNKVLGRRVKLGNHIFASRQANVGAQYKLTTAGVLLLLTLTGLSLGGMVYILAQPVIVFVDGGLAAIGLSAQEEQLDQGFSLAQIAFAANGVLSASAVDTVVAAVVQIVLALTCVLIPIVLQLITFAQVLVPFTLKEQKAVSSLVQQLKWWSLLDVLTVAVFMSFLYIDIFPRLALAVVCRDIDQFIDDFLVPLKILESGNTCFSNSAQLPFGFFILAATAICSAVSVELTNSVSLAAIEDRRAALHAYKVGRSGPPEPIVVDRNLGIWSALMKRRPGWLLKLSLLKSNQRRRRGGQRNPNQPPRNGINPAPAGTTPPPLGAPPPGLGGPPLGAPPPGLGSLPIESHYVTDGAPPPHATRAPGRPRRTTRSQDGKIAFSQSKEFF